MGEGLFACFSVIRSLQYPALLPVCGQDRRLPHCQQLSCSDPFAGGAPDVGLENKLSLLLTCSSKEEQWFTGRWGRGPHHALPWLLYISHHTFKRLPLLPRPRQPWLGRNPGLHCRVSVSQGLRMSIAWEIPRVASDGRAQHHALLEKLESKVMGSQEEMASWTGRGWGDCLLFLYYIRRLSE